MCPVIFSQITEQLKAKGIPTFWQFYILFATTLSVIVFSIRENSSWLYTLSITTHLFIFFGIITSYRSHKQKNYPRLLLVNGAVLIIVAKVLQSLSYLGFPVPLYIPLFVESRVIMDIFQKEVMLSIKQEKFFRTC